MQKHIAQWISIENRLTSIFGISGEMLNIRLIEIGFLKIGQKEVKTLQDIFFDTILIYNCFFYI